MAEQLREYVQGIAPDKVNLVQDYKGKVPLFEHIGLDKQVKGSFGTSVSMPGGIYLVGYPNKSGFFEILIDKQQHFSILADTSTLTQTIQFERSPDNTAFLNYQQTMRDLGIRIRCLQVYLLSCMRRKVSTTAEKC